MWPGLAMTAIAQHEKLEQMMTRNVHKSSSNNDNTSWRALCPVHHRKPHHNGCFTHQSCTARKTSNSLIPRSGTMCKLRHPSNQSLCPCVLSFCSHVTTNPVNVCWRATTRVYCVPASRGIPTAVRRALPLDSSNQKQAQQTLTEGLQRWCLERHLPTSAPCRCPVLDPSPR